MSFAELLVVLVVILLVTKPEDLPNILKQIRRWRAYFVNAKNEIISQINISLDSTELGQNHDEINNYLKKISDIGGYYNGEYDLNKIQNHYKNLVEKKDNTE